MVGRRASVDRRLGKRLENNHNLDVDALVVAEASVGKALSMKRFATRARGRSSQIVKPFSRLRVVVREVEEKDT